MDKIIIMGELYTIIDDEKIDDADGRTDKSTRTIRICKTYNDQPKPGQQQDFKEIKRNLTRHEVIHAMMYESGLIYKDEIHTEPVVEWIASQYPKMKKLFEKLEIE